MCFPRESFSLEQPGVYKQWLHSNLKFYLVLLLPIIVDDSLNCSSARQKILWNSAFKSQRIKKKFFCQILYSMQMTGPGSSKQTKKISCWLKYRQEWWFFSVGSKLIYCTSSSHCLQSKFPLQSKARIQNTNGDF